MEMVCRVIDVPHRLPKRFSTRHVILHSTRLIGQDFAGFSTETRAILADFESTSWRRVVTWRTEGLETGFSLLFIAFHCCHSTAALLGVLRL